VTKRFNLVHDIARQRAMEAVRTAAQGLEVLIREPAKSRDQEEKYHAQIGDIADQWNYLGVKWSREDMKRILVNAFKEDTKNDPELAECWRQVGELRAVPGIRGGLVMLGEQTRKFPKKLASAFVEWLYALGVEQDIEWSDGAIAGTIYREQSPQRRNDSVAREAA
jgi:hypothetical protein